MISLSSYSGSPSISIGGGGVWICEGNLLLRMVREVRCGMCCVFSLRVGGPIYRRSSLSLPLSWMVLSSSNPISWMVVWCGCCMAITTPYLLIWGSDRVFCVDRSFPYVIIVPLPFPLEGCHATPSCQLLMWSFQSSCVWWADVRGWFRSWRKRVSS